MGLMQRAVETYDKHFSLVGVYIEGHDPLAPIGHILTSADIEITINSSGRLMSVRRIGKEEPKVLIPVTEASGGRSGTKAYMNPHPLCDNLKYFTAVDNYYLPQLSSWETSEFSHPFLTAIRSYLEQGTILQDLINALGDVKENDFIIWRVEGIDNELPACWKNKNLHKAYTDYYLNLISSRESSLCMINGTYDTPAKQHPKGVVSINGNAKLISANDSSGFTYRGRFLDENEAAVIGYTASQKAHNAIRWLATEQGVREFSGNRVYICWNPGGRTLPQPLRSLRTSASEPTYEPSDYKDSLKSIITGYGNASSVPVSDTAILVALDAATTGRLSIVYYNEISLPLFFQHMKDWDNECCWYYGKNGIQSPDIFQIVNCAFGEQHKGFLETDDKIMRMHLQRLLNCKVNGGIFPEDIVQVLCKRASTPQSFSERNWRHIVHTACAAIQKYLFDTGQGGNEMAWDLTKKDRSFQFGRLLAVLERAEEDYYLKIGEERQTKAIKYLSEFRQHPWLVYERINRQLQAYLNRIEPWQLKRYTKLVGEICSFISEYPEIELDAPLDNIYLMGYELQRNSFFVKHDERTEEE